MPTFTTPTGSAQRYIPALNRNAPDSIPGTRKIYATHEAFEQGVTDERACVGMGLPVWYDGIDILVKTEPLAVVRRWSLSTGAGTPAGNAAASHGRTVVIGAFSRVLAADVNRVHATSGAPGSGVGTNGDLALDGAAGVVYEKSSGAWASLVSMYGGGSPVATTPGAPTIGTATAGDGAVSIAFTAPASNGGSAILDYQVLLSTGQTATGTTSPIIVTAPNSTPVTATVRARNAVGYGAASAASNSVTPVATSDITSGIVVANRLQVPTVPSAGNVNPLRTYQREHTAHADGAISNLKLSNLWWFISTTTFLPSAISGNPTFTWRQWVEYPQGTFTPVLFGGSADCVLSSTVKLRTSDAVNVTIPAGAKFWVHTVNAGAVSLMPVTETPANASVIGTTDAFYDMADLATPVHQAVGSATVNFIGPSLITGDVAAANAKATALVGDSLVYAQGDVTNVGARGSSGAYARKLDALGASYVKYAQKGATAQAYASGVANANYVEFMNLVRAAVTHVVIQPGINDVRLARTQAQVLADRAILVGDFPGKAVAETTLTPRTSSTDSWATVANQAQQVDGNMAQWANINTAIRGVAGSALMEVANVVANTPGGTVWGCPVGATPPVLDGTHMTSAMAAYAAENISYTVA